MVLHTEIVIFAVLMPLEENFRMKFCMLKVFLQTSAQFVL